MRTCIFVAITLFSLLLLVPCEMANPAGSTQYSIQVESDGSSAWTITRTETQIQSSLDTLIEFKGKVESLVQAAENVTQRSMGVDESEFSLTSNFSGSYVTVEYRFYWQNFSKANDSDIIIGDVFQVENFFSQLYEDGQVTITYPSEYVVKQASPAPYQQNDSLHILTWLGTTDLVNGQTLITLEKQSSTADSAETAKDAAIIAGIIIAAAACSMTLYEVTRRKRKKRKEQEKAEHKDLPEIESDEEKILSLLKTSEKAVNQSSIAEQCRFSKAKTSQLLASMESKGMIKRQTRGREKMVVLDHQDGE